MIPRMANIKGDYWQCYLDGREEKLLRTSLDAGALAKQLVATGGSLRDMVMGECVRAAAPLESGKAKQRWLMEAEEFFEDAGHDADAAYAAYLKGRIDKLAAKTERRVIDALDEMFGDAEESDDEEDEDDDEDGDEEGDE